jgi:serine phosphatase RsbU (regulator of sigma subunit)
MDAAGEQFSDERLEALLRRTPAIGPRQLLRLVVDEVNRFSAGAPQADDITGLVLRYTGPASPTG